MQEQSLTRTFCFVDIAGYTALTGVHGAHAAADLVQDFEIMLQQATERRGSIHEIIGDCAFLVFSDPNSCCTSLLQLFMLINNRENFPIARAGFHHGSALLKNGKYFGSNINLAARVSAQARGGQVLCTRIAADALSLSPPADTAVAMIGRIQLHNIAEPVEIFEVIFAGCSREAVIDPVCKMQVSRSAAAGDIVFKGKHYYFCSFECVERFTKSPSYFAAAEP